MGRHSAPDGAPVDPVVAAALARRAGEPAAGSGGADGVGPDDTARLPVPHAVAEESGSGLGWPAPPDGEPSPGGLGWPGGMPDPARQRVTDDVRERADDAATTDAALAEPAVRPRPRGWRRFFRAA